MYYNTCIFILDICSNNFRTSRYSKTSLYKKLYSVQIESLYFVPYGLLYIYCCSISLYRPPCISRKRTQTKNNKQFDIVNVFTV